MGNRSIARLSQIFVVETADFLERFRCNKADEAGWPRKSARRIPSVEGCCPCAYRRRAIFAGRLASTIFCG
jgi:hypothetical protein